MSGCRCLRWRRSGYLSAQLTDGGSRHVLDNASLYDWLPHQMADLIPVLVGHMDRWNLDGLDPYLMCKYSGTMTVVTFHGIGASICEGGGKPDTI